MKMIQCMRWVAFLTKEAIPLNNSFIRHGHRLRHTCEREVAA